MPYIKSEDYGTASANPKVPGELNYAITLQAIGHGGQVRTRHRTRRMRQPNDTQGRAVGVSSDGCPGRENSVRFDRFAPELADHSGRGPQGNRPTHPEVVRDPDARSTNVSAAI